MIAAIVMALAASGVAPQEPHQFDLTCTLTKLSQRRNGALPERLPVKAGIKTRLRLDLEAKRWCQEECQWRADLEVRDDEIALKHLDEGPNFQWTDIISRTTGTRMMAFMSGESGILEVSECERSDFSGFPVRKF